MNLKLEAICYLMERAYRYPEVQAKAKQLDLNITAVDVEESESRLAAAILINLLGMSIEDSQVNLLAQWAELEPNQSLLFTSLEENLKSFKPKSAPKAATPVAAKSAPVADDFSMFL